MPIPAAAGIVAATVHYFYGLPIQAWWVAIIWVGLVGLCGFLMVSTWRFWSAKELNFSRSHPFQLLLVLVICGYIMYRFSNVVFLAMGLIYMFSGIWARAAYGWTRRRRRRPAGITPPEAVDAEPDSLRPL
jgi:CDP-diacylglycerol--serine O-phosphatidyltransferase